MPQKNLLTVLHEASLLPEKDRTFLIIELLKLVNEKMRISFLMSVNESVDRDTLAAVKNLNALKKQLQKLDKKQELNHFPLIQEHTDKLKELSGLLEQKLQEAHEREKN